MLKKLIVLSSALLALNCGAALGQEVTTTALAATFPDMALRGLALWQQFSFLN